MSTLYEKIGADLDGVLDDLVAAGDLPADLNRRAVSVESPRDPAHGDLATNAALVLSKAARVKPRDLADKIAAGLTALARVETAEVAGPGFINLRLAPDLWREELLEILERGADYGRSTLGAGRKINVEFVSANPTGPLHVGHSRGAVFGDALASLLAFTGFEVSREYYINDAGSQIVALARSVHHRYLDALGDAPGPIPEGLYPGDYLVPVAEAIAARDGDKWRGASEADWLSVFRDEAVSAMMAAIRGDLVALGIGFDVFSSEAALVAEGKVDEALAVLTERGLIYTGVLEPPKGKRPDNWEPRPQTLFRSTQFGDDVDRPLKKSDDTWTYFASDTAYHLDKFRRGFAEMIDVWGADHGGYVKRMKAAVTAITDETGALDVKICQLVNLLDNGQPIKMSKRAGQFVTLRGVVDAVGKDVVRFIMLTRRNDASLDFDVVKVTEQSRENPVFYVHYAHARICSVLRNALASGITESDRLEDARSVALLRHPDELGLVKLMAAWPRVIEGAAVAHEPHRLAFYLHELASAFHALWNKGNEDSSLRFLVEDDPAMTRARLAMLRGVRSVIASGLGVIGVTPVEEMR